MEPVNMASDSEGIIANTAPVDLPLPAATDGPLPPTQSPLLPPTPPSPLATEAVESSSSEHNRSSTATLKGELTEQLVKVLQRQHEIIFEQENISSYFPGDVGRVAGRCWSQVHPHIDGAAQEKYQRLMEEFGVRDQLAKMEQLKAAHSPSLPAWRPTGIPRQDFFTAVNAESLKQVPEFEKILLEAQKQTLELQELLQQRREKLQSLEGEIRASMAALSTRHDVTLSPESNAVVTFDLSPGTTAAVTSVGGAWTSSLENGSPGPKSEGDPVPSQTNSLRRSPRPNITYTK